MVERSQSLDRITDNLKRCTLENTQKNGILKNPVRQQLPKYTKQRENYENYFRQRLERGEYDRDLERQQQQQKFLNDAKETGYGSNCDATLESLKELQKFRLKHANDCFSSQRKLELKIQKVLKIDENASICPTIIPKPKSKTMPYAMSQRILRLQLESEAKSEAANSKKKKTISKGSAGSVSDLQKAK